MSADYTLADLYRRVSQLVRRGVIHSVQASPPRCRVTFGADPVSGAEHVSDWLLWHTHSDSERSDWSVPAIGAPALVVSAGGETRNGVVFPGLITDDQAPAGSSPTQHATRYSDGATVLYDTASHALEVSLPPGGTVNIIGVAGITLDGPVIITKTLIVQESAEVTGDIKSGATITAASDVNDGKGSLESVRAKYNSHTHNENGDGGGTTDGPNEKF